MKLIIGLGNPGKTYEKTRHNVGFMLLDSLAKKWGVAFQAKSKYKAEIAEVTVNSERILLAKPTTFYNLSGEAARAISDFYKLASDDILVVHDDMALPFGTIRARVGGSDAGNNGVKSLSQHLGADYARIRIGTDGELRAAQDPSDFVLSKFTTQELTELPMIETVALEIIEDFIAEKTLTHVTKKPNP